VVGGGHAVQFAAVVQREQVQAFDTVAFEPHLGVVAHFYGALAQDKRQARHEQHNDGHDGRDQEFLVRSLQVESDDGLLRDVRRVVTPKASPCVVVGTILAVPSNERVALSAQRVHAALQVDLQMAVLGYEQFVFAWRHCVIHRDRPRALCV